MFHATIPLPDADAFPSDPDVATMLARLAEGVDHRFVQAGQSLMTALERIGHVVELLDGVTGALGGEAALTAVRDMGDMARQMSALPETQVAREQALAGIAQTARQLGSDVADMSATLRVLGFYGVNIKIAASGESDFVGFVDGMNVRLALGEQNLGAILAELRSFTGSVTEVREAGQKVASECARVIPQVPDRLIADAQALNEYLGYITGIARQVSTIGRDVRARVSVVLASVQVGDMVRQRIEHVVAALRMMDDLPGDPDVREAAHAYVRRLSAAHLRETAADFQRETGRLLESLKGLGREASRLLALIDEQGGDSGHSFLVRLETGIAEGERITAQLSHADARSREMVGVVSGTVDALAVRFAHLERVRQDVQDIATNTRLLCRRYGLIGRAVAVVAAEIDACADRLAKASLRVKGPIGALRDFRQTMAGGDTAGIDRDMGEVLARALATVRAGCAQSERSVTEGRHGAEALVTMLRSAGRGLTEEFTLGDTLERLADDLEIRSPDLPLSEAAIALLHDLLPRIARSYTMASERVLHDGFLLPGMDPISATSSAGASTDSADDDDDDGLF